MIEHFKYDVRVRHHVNNTLGDQQKDLPKLYIKSFNPNITKAPTPIEGALKRFEVDLTRSFNNIKSFNSTNMKKSNKTCYFTSKNTMNASL